MRSVPNIAQGSSKENAPLEHDLRHVVAGAVQQVDAGERVAQRAEGDADI